MEAQENFWVLALKCSTLKFLTRGVFFNPVGNKKKSDDEIQAQSWDLIALVTPLCLLCASGPGGFLDVPMHPRQTESTLLFLRCMSFWCRA